MKFFIGKIGESTGAFVLVDKDNKLFSATSIVEAEELFRKLFDRKLEIGKIFYYENDEPFFFANIENGAEDSVENLPEEWSFKTFADLSAENCSDFEAIKFGFAKLGWL